VCIVCSSGKPLLYTAFHPSCTLLLQCLGYLLWYLWWKVKRTSVLGCIIRSCTVVQHHVNGNQAFLWETAKFDPWQNKKPLYWLIWNCEYMITSGRYAPISTFVKNAVQQGLLGRVVKYNILNFFMYHTFFCHHLQLRPINRCSCAVAQITWNHSGMCLLGSEHSIFTSPPLKPP